MVTGSFHYRNSRRCTSGFSKRWTPTKMGASRSRRWNLSGMETNNRHPIVRPTMKACPLRNGQALFLGRGKFLPEGKLRRVLFLWANANDPYPSNALALAAYPFVHMAVHYFVLVGI